MRRFALVLLLLSTLLGTACSKAQVGLVLNRPAAEVSDQDQVTLTLVWEQLHPPTHLSSGLAFLAGSTAVQQQIELLKNTLLLQQAKTDQAAQAQQAQLAESSYEPEPEYQPPHQTGGLTPAKYPCAIPAYICTRESNNTINAENPVSSASGKYQFLDSTWNGYGGYSHAADAPEEVQDAKARETYAGGAGASHWACC